MGTSEVVLLIFTFGMLLFGYLFFNDADVQCVLGAEIEPML